MGDASDFISNDFIGVVGAVYVNGGYTDSGVIVSNVLKRSAYISTFRLKGILRSLYEGKFFPIKNEMMDLSRSTDDNELENSLYAMSGNFRFDHDRCGIRLVLAKLVLNKIFNKTTPCFEYNKLFKLKETPNQPNNQQLYLPLPVDMIKEIVSRVSDWETLISFFKSSKCPPIKLPTYARYIHQLPHIVFVKASRDRRRSRVAGQHVQENMYTLLMRRVLKITDIASSLIISLSKELEEDDLNMLIAEVNIMDKRTMTTIVKTLINNGRQTLALHLVTQKLIGENEFSIIMSKNIGITFDNGAMYFLDFSHDAAFNPSYYLDAIRRGIIRSAYIKISFSNGHNLLLYKQMPRIDAAYLRQYTRDNEAVLDYLLLDRDIPNIDNGEETNIKTLLFMIIMGIDITHHDNLYRNIKGGFLIDRDQFDDYKQEKQLINIDDHIFMNIYSNERGCSQHNFWMEVGLHYFHIDICDFLQSLLILPKNGKRRRSIIEKILQVIMNRDDRNFIDSLTTFNLFLLLEDIDADESSLPLRNSLVDRIVQIDIDNLDVLDSYHMRNNLPPYLRYYQKRRLMGDEAVVSIVLPRL